MSKTGFIVKGPEMGQVLRIFPTTEAGIICPQCFADVQKTLALGDLVYWCACYARVFGPNNPNATGAGR
jgi:hypothetical protein